MAPKNSKEQHKNHTSLPKNNSNIHLKKHAPKSLVGSKVSNLHAISPHRRKSLNQKNHKSINYKKESVENDYFDGDASIRNLNRQPLPPSDRIASALIQFLESGSFKTTKDPEEVIPDTIEEPETKATYDIGELQKQFEMGLQNNNLVMAWFAYRKISKIDKRRINSIQFGRLLRQINRTHTEFDSRASLDMAQYILGEMRNSFETRPLRMHLNELLRILAKRKKMKFAINIKNAMKERSSDSTTMVDAYTYAALFSGLNPNSKADLGLGVQLFDEMQEVGIYPTIQIFKVLLRGARKCKEKDILVHILLQLNNLDTSAYENVVAQRFYSITVKSWLSLENLPNALMQLRKLAAIPYVPVTKIASTDPMMSNHKFSIKSIKENHRHNFYYILQKSYSDVIVYCMENRLHELVRELFEEFRQQSMIPPTPWLYLKLLEYFGKRKLIDDVKVLFRMMREDGIQPSIDAYVSVISNCMRQPSARYVESFTKKIISESAKDLESDSGPIKVTSSWKAILMEKVNKLVYRPQDCIEFYESYIDEASQGLVEIQAGSCQSLTIGCFVIDAYKSLNQPGKILSVFERMVDVYNLNPVLAQTDMDRKTRTIMISDMAKDTIKACRMLGKRKKARLIKDSLLRGGIAINI
ncbi:hypothetical protein H4219_000691 [Mycoemilia scoparia]|uniref:Pentatricopeptide repeat-containing protein n=1 Tax=Mycoemilia scoparia TaxID=417184 RepID=A0A9W8DR93_9FUNG|nr:hypothetical protein H4219_000691 [Mycoemilia scoparia]